MKSRTWTTISEASTRVLELPARRNATISWIWEIGAMFLSTGAMFSAVATMAWMDGKTFTAWRCCASMNTIISALGTISRTTLAFAVSACIGQQKWNWLRKRPDTLTSFSRFDEASRGPLGGIKLVFWLKARHWGTLGALVMIGSLAFDPFLQAIISSEGRLDEIPVPRVPTIGRSTGADFGTAMPMETYFYKKGFNYHDPNDANDTATGDLEVGVSPTTNFAIAGSVLNGFYNSTSFRNQTVGFRCKTGNCTWPIFSSLAVCTSCVDVSNHIKSKSYPGGDYSRTTYKLPYAQIENNDGRKGKHPWDRTEVVINSTAHPQQTISFTDKDTLLISFLAMLGAPSWRSNQTNWNESKPEAYECALLLCANAYESKSRDGILEENIVGSWSQRNPTSYRPLHSGYNATELAAFETALGPSLYKVYDNLTIERTALQLMIPPQESTFLPENAPRLFNFTYLDIIGTIDYLRQLSKKSQSWPYAGNGDTGPSVPEMLGKSTNITLTFERVGKSMTDQIRDLAASPVSGTAYRWTTHVNVEWAYLTLPVLMILFGCIHVILTIVESRKLGLPAWKEDTLPVLLHGFNDHIQNLLRDAQTDPKAAKAAESVLISFSEDKNRLRIVS